MRETYSIKQAANELNVCGEAIRRAIMKKRIPAVKACNHWTIKAQDLINYLRTRYSHAGMLHKGKRVYNPEKGDYSPKEIAQMFNVSQNSLYYLMNCKGLWATKKGAAWVINIKDAEEYFNNRKVMNG